MIDIYDYNMRLVLKVNECFKRNIVNGKNLQVMCWKLLCGRGRLSHQELVTFFQPKIEPAGSLSRINFDIKSKNWSLLFGLDGVRRCDIVTGDVAAFPRGQRTRQPPVSFPKTHQPAH